MVGVKPSRGRVCNAPNSNPRGGLITSGPIARTVRDAALMLDVIAGPEPGDLFTAPEQEPTFLNSADHEPKRLKIGMLVASKRWIDPQVIAAVHNTAALLVKLGHQVEDADVDLGGLEVVFRVMVEAENAAIKAESLEQFSDPYTRWCRASGARKSAADYIRAAEVMFRRSREIITQSARWDCLLVPTITVPPPLLAAFLSVVERTADDDLAITPFTFPFNITGQPAISLPLGRSADGLPIGVQLVGRLFDEATLFGLAAQIERAAPWGGGYPGSAAWTGADGRTRHSQRSRRAIRGHRENLP